MPSRQGNSPCVPSSLLSPTDRPFVNTVHHSHYCPSYSQYLQNSGDATLTLAFASALGGVCSVYVNDEDHSFAMVIPSVYGGTRCSTKCWDDTQLLRIFGKEGGV